MSLESAWGKFLTIVKMKPVYIGVGLVVLLLLTWWGLTSFQNYRAKKNIENLKINANVALQNVANAQAKVDRDKVDEAVQVQNFNVAVHDYVGAVNATDQQKIETDKAIANVEKAVNANIPVGTTAQDVHKMLDDLDKQQ